MAYKITMRANHRASNERSIWGVLDNGDKFHVWRSNGKWELEVAGVKKGKYAYISGVYHDLERGCFEEEFPWVNADN